jgi:hypothetical protein
MEGEELMNGVVRAGTDLFFSDLEGKDFSDGILHKANLGGGQQT